MKKTIFVIINLKKGLIEYIIKNLFIKNIFMNRLKSIKEIDLKLFI
jgi:hypothetical protein